VAAKRLELLQVDEFGLSIEPGLGQSMNLAVEVFDQYLRTRPRFVPSPTPMRPGPAACGRNTRKPADRTRPVRYQCGISGMPPAEPMPAFDSEMRVMPGSAEHKFSW
jgi:hypothetical protein